jgi:hypothetical protein
MIMMFFNRFPLQIKNQPLQIKNQDFTHSLNSTHSRKSSIVQMNGLGILIIYICYWYLSFFDQDPIIIFILLIYYRLVSFLARGEVQKSRLRHKINRRSIIRVFLTYIGHLSRTHVFVFGTVHVHVL